jgi:hypothetical protein
MKSLNNRAKKIFFDLCSTMDNGPYIICKGFASKINNTDCFMPVSIERIQTLSGEDGISIAHYFVQNGDLMADPEMEFIIEDNEVYPISFKLDSLGIYQYAKLSEDEKDEKLQEQLTFFANQWMKNIQLQQFS